MFKTMMTAALTLLVCTNEANSQGLSAGETTAAPTPIGSLGWLAGPDTDESALVETGDHVVCVIGSECYLMFEYLAPHHTTWHNAKLLELGPFASTAAFRPTELGTSAVAAQANDLDGALVAYQSVPVTAVTADAFANLLAAKRINRAGIVQGKPLGPVSQAGISPNRTSTTTLTSIGTGTVGSSGGGGSGIGIATPFACGWAKECDMTSWSDCSPNGDIWKACVLIASSENCEKKYSVRCVPAAELGYTWELESMYPADGKVTVPENGTGYAEFEYRLVAPAAVPPTNGDATLTIEAMAAPQFHIANVPATFEAHCSLTPVSLCVGVGCGGQPN